MTLFKKLIDPNDERVLMLMQEIDTSETADKAAQKIQAKTKGYMDDEFDLAYCLKDAKIKAGPLPVEVSVFLLVLFGIVLGVWLLHFGAEDLSFYIGAAPVGAYIGWIYTQKVKYFNKIVSLDFDAKILGKSELKQLLYRFTNESGSIYLKTTKGSFNKGLKLLYDNRPTYFLDYNYSIGKGDNRKFYSHTLVIQEHKLNFPNALCYNKKTTIPISFFKDDIQLEGSDFNKEYKVYVSDKSKSVDAFYVLNPRVMIKLLEPEVKEILKVFETMGTALMVGTTKCPSGSQSLRTQDPIISYDEYKKVKDEMLRRLDIATDVTDVLMREIVDKGDQRSIAKEL